MAACGRPIALGLGLQVLKRTSYATAPCTYQFFRTIRGTNWIKWTHRNHNPDLGIGHDFDTLPSYAQRLAEWEAANDKSPVSTGVNIGLPFLSSTNSKTNMSKVRTWTKSRVALEKAARHQELIADLEAVQHEWRKESAPRHIRTMAQHYGIYRDLFDGAHFDAVVPLDVWYDYDDEFVTPVKYGNIVPAKEASMSPSADYEAEEGSLWTLVMTSPDQNLEDSNSELLHWAVGNIPGNDLAKGETLCNFLQPFPVKGAGYLRYVFILYKQSGPMDLAPLRRSSECTSLRERSFSTLEFFRQHQDDLIPSGLAFHQSQWDSSVRSVFHNVLDMPEPKFEFMHPPTYFPEQEEVPHKQAFNMYLDNYRDVKDLNEEVLKYKLKDLDPTKPPPPKMKYNCIDLLSKNTPTWYRLKSQHQRQGKYHWKQMYEDPKE